MPPGTLSDQAICRRATPLKPHALGLEQEAKQFPQSSSGSQPGRRTEWRARRGRSLREAKLWLHCPLSPVGSEQWDCPEAQGGPDRGQRKRFFGIETMKSRVSLAKGGRPSPVATRVPASSRQGCFYPEAHTPGMLTGAGLQGHEAWVCVCSCGRRGSKVEARKGPPLSGEKLRCPGADLHSGSQTQD